MTSFPESPRSRHGLSEILIFLILLHLLLWWWWSHDSNDNILMMMRRVDKGTPRLDVMNLQEQLDLKLQQRQARETGICQVSSPWDPIQSKLSLSILLSDSPRTVRPVLRWTHKTGFVNHWITGYQLKQSQNILKDKNLVSFIVNYKLHGAWPFASEGSRWTSNDTSCISGPFGRWWLQ